MTLRFLARASIAALVLATGAVAVAANASQAAKEACFQAHANLMDKPALTNANDCWRAHGYLMIR